METPVKSWSTHYENLGLTPEATGEEIAQAFARRINIPITSPEEACEHAARIYTAYETLRDPLKRRAYDAAIGLWSPSPEPAQEVFEPASEHRVAPFIAAKAREPSDQWIQQADVSRDDPHDDTLHAVHERAPALEFAHARTDRNYSGAIAGGAIAALGLVVLVLSVMAGNNRGPSVPRETPALTGAQAASRADATPVAAPQQALPPVGIAPKAAPDPDSEGIDAAQLTKTPPAPGDAVPPPGLPLTEIASETSGADTPAAAQPEAAAKSNDVAPPAGEATSQTQPAAKARPPGNEVAPATPQSAAAPQAPPPPPRQLVNLQAPARQLSGGLTSSDNPRGYFHGTVGVQFTVDPSGHVTACRTVLSSGNPDLDLRTCRLVQLRMRFTPALDAQGRPVASELHATYTWTRTHHSLADAMRGLVQPPKRAPQR